MCNEIEEKVKQALFEGLVQIGNKETTFEYGYVFLPGCHDEKELAVQKAQEVLTKLFISEEIAYPSVSIPYENGFAYYFLIPTGNLSEVPNKIETLEISTRVIGKATVH